MPRQRAELRVEAAGAAVVAGARRRQVAATSPTRRARGPGVFTLGRLLLQRPSSTQVTLARWSGLSQPRVSQILTRLTDLELVGRGQVGWRPLNWDRLCDWWLTHYPGPGGVATWWLGLDQPGDQLQSVLAALEPHVREGVVVSGDVAADQIVPWRRPAQLILYSRTGADLSRAGLVPVATRAEATTGLIVAADPGVWLSGYRHESRFAPDDTLTGGDGSSLRVADGLQVLYDVCRSPGPDADEAAQRWRTHLREQVTRR